MGSFPLLSFVPHDTAFDLIQHSNVNNPIGRERRFEAVALFADVSGFTAISEALSKTGKKGAEELTAILNSYFETMIDLIVSYGGIVGKFGGDAMTVLFTNNNLRVAQQEEQETSKPLITATGVNREAEMVNRAVACALEMQARMPQYSAIPTSVGSYSLAMKAGLAIGQVLCTSVGYLDEDNNRLEYIIAGEVLDLCAEAEHHAGKGEVVVHNKMLEYLEDTIITEERHGFSLITALTKKPGFNPLPELNFTTEMQENELLMRQLAAYLHPSLVQRLKEGMQGFLNEHRKVTVLFVSFRGFDYDHDGEVSRKLQVYLEEVFRLIAYYGGYLNKVDMGDKGSKYIVLFGAPVAYEDSEERAVLCALELIKLGGDFVQPKIGVNTGNVFCGQVGSAKRQEYTVMGDAVNLAARLMQAAQIGQVLVSGFTRQYAKSKFQWMELPPITVKGKSEPVAIFEAKKPQASSTSQRTYSLPMVGRDKELAQANALLERMIAGSGQIIGLSAEAGLGKSRLTAEIIKLATEREIKVLFGECLSHATTTGYLVWRNIWQHFFGLDWQTGKPAQVARLEEQLNAIDPALLPRLPLLGAVLDLVIEDNNLTRSMEAKLRKASLESLLVACLRHKAAQSPLVLVLEDAHWLDDLSYDLLEAVGRDIADVPVLVLLVYRPNEQFERISKLSYFNLIALQDFDAESARKLIDLKLEQWFGDTAQVNQELIEQISQKAQGNPFYIEELVNYLRDKQIDLQSGENLNFPDTLHSLILSRVDQLMEDEKTTLKVASILGREFAFRSLLETYAPLGTPEQVRGYLDKLSKLDITPLDVPEPELIYIFKHAITQEVTYESLPYSLREFLHDQAGLYFERDMPDKYDLLAYHFGRSSNRDKQRVYFRFAAINAARAYNSRVAIEYYQRLLDLITAEEKVDIMLKLGEIWRLIGKRTEAETILDTALSLAKNLNLPTLIAQCQNDLGRFLWFKGQYDEALQLLVPSLQTYQVLNNKAGIAEAQSNLAKVYWRQGNYNSGFQNFQSALEMFRQLNDLRNVGKTLWNMGLIYQEQGNNEQAQIYFDEQMQIAESIDDKQALSEAYGSLGMYQTQRNLVLATEYFLKKYYISEEIGDSIGISYAIGNLAEVYRLLGYRDESLNCNYYRLRLALKINEKIQVVHTLLNIAIVYFDKKNYEETYRFISIGFEHARNFPMLFCYFLYYKLQLSLVTNQLEDAFIISEDLISLSAKLNNQEILFKGTIEQIKLKSLTKKITSLQALEMYQALLEVWKGSKEQGVLYLEMWRITGNEEFAEKATKLLTKLYLNNPQLEYKQFLIELGNEPEQTLPVLPILLVVHHSKGEVDKILAEI